MGDAVGRRLTVRSERGADGHASRIRLKQGIPCPSRVGKTCSRPARAGRRAHADSRAPRFHRSPRRPVPANAEPRPSRRALIEGFPGSGGALALAEATIYVPTQRAAAGLAEALLAASGRGSLLLPRIAPLGAFEPDEPRPSPSRARTSRPAPARRPRSARSPARTRSRAPRAWGEALRGAIRAPTRTGSSVRRRRAGAGRLDPS